MKAVANQTGATLTAHVTQTERRLTMLEAEFGWIKTGMKRITHAGKDES